MYAACPHCSKTFHLKTKLPEKEWRAAHAPETPAREMPKVTCPSCWKAGKRNYDAASGPRTTSLDLKGSRA